MFIRCLITTTALKQNGGKKCVTMNSKKQPTQPWKNNCVVIQVFSGLMDRKLELELYV